MFFPLVIIVIVINLIIIVLLLIGLVLTIPVAVLIFIYNLKNGFRAVELADEEEGQNTLELPPEIERGETVIFNSDPALTLAQMQVLIRSLTAGKNPECLQISNAHFTLF